LVSSVSGYEKYLTVQAWTWELQALVNARLVLGHGKIAKDFSMIRKNALCQNRDPKVLKKSICNMRDKMLINLASEQDSLKVTMGGMVDVEFIAQYGVLLLAYEHDALTQQYGTVALLKMLASYAFLPLEQIIVLSEAYDYYQKQQRLLLLQTNKNESVAQLKKYQVDVALIWGDLFEEARRC
jgi:glutamate-ammonia-ligase adenylyltransferase